MSKQENWPATLALASGLIPGAVIAAKTDMFEGVIFGCMSFVLGALYLLPSIIAHANNTRRHWWLFGWNVAFGWTLLGWAICLIWAMTAERE
jgi:Superinfection immunity protein